MTIDSKLQNIEYNPPIIRQINQAACKTPWKESISLWLGQLWNGFPLSPKIIQVKEEIITNLEQWINNSVMYSPNAWNLKLREDIAKEQNVKDGKKYDIDNVLVTIWVQNAMQTTIW
jgi:aspartate/methionine/tyrosine aminotransferase